MSKDFNNIEDIFKEAFDGFEANVDPSVWSNIQQNIGAGSNGVTQNNPSSAVVGSSKALLTKLVAGIVITSGLATTTYFILKDDQSTIPTEQIAEDNSTSIENVTTNLEETVENTTNAGTDAQIVQNTVDSENELEKKSTLSTNEKQISSNQKSASNVVTITNTNTSIEVANKTNATTTATNQSTSPKTNEKVKTEVVEFNPRIKSSTTKGKAPLDVEFNLDGNAAGYLWDFGDGTPSSSLENPFHTFAKPGKYKVTLTAIDKNANAKTAVQIITVENAITSKLAAVPTVFSPNGDGLNDVIKVEGEHITQFNAVVRDVKGNVVFEWDTIEGFWDGRDNGNRLMPAGTYYLVVVAVGADGEKHTVKQSLQLFQ